MSPTLFLFLLAADAADIPFQGQESTIQQAARAELDRARGLRLPDQDVPYFIAMELSEGWSAAATATFGQLQSDRADPWRHLRVDVRMGSPSFDNVPFAGSMGSRGGTVVRALPEDDHAMALRREMWLALDSAYKGATEQFAGRKAALSGRPMPKVPSFAPAPALQLPPVAITAPEAAATARRVATLTAAVRDRNLEQANAQARDWGGRRYLLTSEGAEVWQPLGGAALAVELVARAPDGGRIRDLRTWVAADPALLPTEADLTAEVETMADWVDTLRGAPVGEDYLGPVLFEQAAAVELFRQLLLPEIVGTPPLEQEPDPYGIPAEGPPTARIGRRLLPSGWTVWDDPTADLKLPGAYTHDQEGVAGERVDLVADGVLRDVLMSRAPRTDRERSNGHGRGLGADRRLGLPSLLWVEPDRSVSMKRLKKQALQLARTAGLDHVIVVKRIEPPGLTETFEVALSGDAPLSGLTRPLEVVRLYADGREEPIRGLSFSGVDRRVLRDIAAAGPMGPPVGVLDEGQGPGRYSLGAVSGLLGSWTVPAVLVTEVELRAASASEPRVIPSPP